MLRALLSGCLLVGLAAWSQAAEDVGLRVPEGFQVTRFADDDLAHDIYSLTVNSRGEVVVSGAGYVKRLLDDDGDGRADRAVLFSNLPKSGAHGMLFDGDDLLCSGDAGLLRFRDANRDGIADGPPETIARLKITEHGINGLTRGPDGWIYIACGNDAGVTAALAATSTSPVREPNQGAILRFSADLAQSEILAHGFRNPYDLAFGPGGRLFTVDSDGERDQYLPWYSPTRLFDVAAGQHHGWLVVGWQRSWNKPAYFFDGVPRVVEIGRGSPTGVLAYQHDPFPTRYRDGVFAACWTLGKVYFFPLVPQGSSYAGTKEVFLETVGDVGFAPVDLEVAPDGSLLVAIGGRGTRGSVFRVTYVGPREPSPPMGDSLSPACREVLAAPQPLAAWSRARWKPRAERLNRRELADAAATAPAGWARRRAIEILVELSGGIDLASAERIAGGVGDLPQAEQALLLDRLFWALGAASPTAEAKQRADTILRRLADACPDFAARRGWESLARLPKEVASHEEQWMAGLRAPDRGVRAACLAADKGMGTRPVEPPAATDMRGALAFLWRRWKAQLLDRSDFALAARVYLAADRPEAQLEAVRLMQLAIGDVRLAPSQPDVYTGYIPAAAEVPDVRADLAPIAARGASGDPQVDRELARLFSMLAAHVAPPELLFQNRFSAASKVEEDIHYLIAASRWAGKWKDAARFADAVARLHLKMRAGPYYPSRNWPTRVGEVVEQFAQADATFATTLIAHPEFRWPAQSFLIRHLPPADRASATRRLLQAWAQADPADEDYRWPGEFVGWVGQLPAEEALPALRLAWSDYGLRDRIAPILFREEVAAADQQRWREALELASPEVVAQAAAARARGDAPLNREEATAVIAALRRQCAAPQQAAARQALADLLQRGTGQRIAVREARGDLLAAYQPWFAWHAATYPEEAQKLTAAAGFDAAGWQERVAAIAQLTGDVARGKVAFERRSCAKCHAGASRFGPDLAGAAGRFAPADLLAAIVDPSKEVAPSFQTTQVETAAGKIYVGLVAYESPESTLLLTGPDTSLRVAGEEIVAMRPSRQSLMPAGLLQGAENQEVADLLAYLSTLKAAK